MSRTGFPIVISAPSGAGKTTLAQLLIQSMPDLCVSVSYTTREKRGNERNGVDYNFVSEEEFEQMVAAGDFLEWAHVHGHRYGSAQSWTANQLNNENDVVFDIDVQGGLQIKSRYENAVLIFIVPPNLVELKTRLEKRGTEQPEKITQRLSAASREIDVGLEKYDYVITNKHLDRALFDLTAIVRTHRLKQFNRAKIRSRLLEN